MADVKQKILITSGIRQVGCTGTYMHYMDMDKGTARYEGDCGGHIYHIKVTEKQQVKKKAVAKKKTKKLTLGGEGYQAAELEDY